jgi:hypothetical protein
VELSIANVFGNVDVRRPLPKQYVHVKGERLQPLCRKLKIKFAQALTGFTPARSKRYPAKPNLYGVVISSRSAPKLLKAIEDREQRNPPEKREKAAEAARRRREQQQQAFRTRCCRLGIYDPEGRTATALRRGYIDEDFAHLMAFKASYRHEHTDYDYCLQMYRDDADCRDAARDMARPEPIPPTWPEYLDRYGFGGAVADALAGVLADPKKCHPVWFCEAMIAVRRAELDPTKLTYQAIREAIADWRFDRENPDE